MALGSDFLEGWLQLFNYLIICILSCEVWVSCWITAPITDELLECERGQARRLSWSVTNPGPT